MTEQPICLRKIVSGVMKAEIIPYYEIEPTEFAWETSVW